MGEKRIVSNGTGSAGANGHIANLDAKKVQFAHRHRLAMRHRKVLAVLSCIVVVATAFALMVPGMTMTKGELTCGFEEHAHADACFTQVLACGQEEIAGHSHTDACYEKQLACGQEEDEKHAHTDACYEKQLACGQEESEGHSHSDACYESQQTCGTPEHTHTDSCYTHEQASDDDAVANSTASASSEGASEEAASKEAASEEAASKNEASKEAASADAAVADEASKEATSEEAASKDEANKDEASKDAASKDAASKDAASKDAASKDAASKDAASKDAASKEAASKDEAKMPAVEFEKTIERADGSDVKVSVKAPEGALPEGATMEAKLISADDVESMVKEAIERESGEAAKIKGITAVDITFKDKAGKEIEPAKAVEVKITSDDVRDYDNPSLVHVLDKSKASSKGNPYDAEVVTGVQIVNEDDNNKTVGNENTMKFESEAF